MPASMVSWDAPPNAIIPGVVYHSKLDDRYMIEVQRTGERSANLVIYDHERDDAEIACWEVGLSYGALFGPDVADVGEWQGRVVDFVDNHYAYRGPQNG